MKRCEQLDHLAQYETKSINKTKSIASDVFLSIYTIVIGGSSVCGIMIGGALAIEQHERHNGVIYTFFPSVFLGFALGGAAGALIGATSPVVVPALIFKKIYETNSNSFERRSHPWSP